MGDRFGSHGSIHRTLFDTRHWTHGHHLAYPSPPTDRAGWRRVTMKAVGSLLPEHEGLRRAVQWLAAQMSWDAKTIEEASRRFDLSPIDEEFLLQHFRGAGHDSGNPIA
jgi:hypothetical protein